jgi:hypothetical protein
LGPLYFGCCSTSGRAHALLQQGRIRYDIATLLPDAPSRLGRLGAKSFGARVDQAVANLQKLSAADPVKMALLPALEKEVAELHQADLAEDATREDLNSRFAPAQ